MTVVLLVRAGGPIFEASPATDTLWYGMTSGSLSLLGPVVDSELARFRFGDELFSDVNGGEGIPACAEAGSGSCWIQLSTRDVFDVADEGVNGGVVAMVGWFVWKIFQLYGLGRWHLPTIAVRCCSLLPTMLKLFGSYHANGKTTTFGLSLVHIQQ